MTYGTIELQEFLVLGKLKLDPRRFGVAISVPFGQEIARLLAFAMGKEPPRGLGEEHGEGHNNSGEEKLKPERDQPRVVALDLKASASGTGSQDGSDQPSGVAKTGDDATLHGMSSLDDPDGTRTSGNGDTEADEETTTDDLTFRSIGHSSRLNDCSDDDEGRADQHADTASKAINGGSHERKSCHTSDLMHGRNETGPDALVLAIEMGEEVFLVVEQTAQQHAIVSVHGLAEKADQESKPQKDSSRVSPGHGFLENGGIVGFATVDFLDLDDLFQGLVRDGISLYMSHILGGIDGVDAVDGLGADFLFGRHLDDAGVVSWALVFLLSVG